ncbi:formyltransferase [Variovorax paradoxus]|uniref:formyltransferase n=1 Tax=Variovorax paradoxus TaxID=34073 RepID=UPI0038685452
MINAPGMSALAPSRGPTAVVFAYSDVGVRCLRVLLDAGVRVPLVITHSDDPSETRWFGSVAELAADHGLTCVAPDNPNSPEFLAFASKLVGRPDLLFSFYYRRMLSSPWLTLPASGAFNMHGSLLPKYRGRAPVNWAVIHGERETGATLHAMNERPDNGGIVDQCAVPILGDDTARDVFNKVVVAAEVVLARSLPALIDGSAVLTPQDFSRGSYFGARRPQDGRIPIDATVLQIHDLVRALAPPFPGAFLMTGSRRVFIERTRHAAPPSGVPNGQLRLWSDGAALWLMSADGGALQVLAARIEGEIALLDATGFQRRFEGGCIHAGA